MQPTKHYTVSQAIHRRGRGKCILHPCPHACRFAMISPWCSSPSAKRIQPSPSTKTLVLASARPRLLPPPLFSIGTRLFFLRSGPRLFFPLSGPRLVFRRSGPRLLAGSPSSFLFSSLFPPFCPAIPLPGHHHGRKRLYRTRVGTSKKRSRPSMAQPQPSIL